MKRRDSTAAIVCIGVFAFFVLFQINLSTISRLNQINSKMNRVVAEKKRSLDSRIKWNPLPPPPQHSLKAAINCDRSHYRYDICSINSPTVLDTTTSTFYTHGPPHVEKIRPYTRKWESPVMSRIKEVKLTSGPLISPPCEIHHNVPALVFSAGGYTGNFYHEFDDGFIPLFITVDSILHDQDFVLVIAKSSDWWIRKYAELLHAFTKHPVVNLDNETATHCFPSATVGLISHGFMTIDPSSIPNSKTVVRFRSLLEKAYSQPQNHPSIFRPTRSRPRRPRLILISRTGNVGRVMLNQVDVKTMAEKQGFEVIIFEPKPSTRLAESYALINSSHAMIGVHGAAITHLLFLRPGTVFVQVVPIGTVWASEVCYGKLSRDLGLEYMEYRIGVEESSLVDKYGKDSMLLKEPLSLQKEGWSNEMGKYLKEQDVRLDLDRFRGYLKKAYKKAKKFMYKVG